MATTTKATLTRNAVSTLTDAINNQASAAALWASAYQASATAHEGGVTTRALAAAYPNQVTGKAHSDSTANCYIHAALITNQDSYIEVLAELGITKLPHNVISHAVQGGTGFPAIRVEFAKLENISDTAKRQAAFMKLVKGLAATPRKTKSAAEKAAAEAAKAEKVAKAKAEEKAKAEAADVRNAVPSEKAKYVEAIIVSMVRDLDNDVPNSEKAAAAVMAQALFLKAAIDRFEVKAKAGKTAAA